MDVVLVGLPGSGKSVVGRRLAARHHAPFVDLDAVVEQEAGTTVAEIFAAEGEAGFRARERTAIDGLGAPGAGNGVERVIAAGGGALVDPRSRWRLLHGRRAVWLDVRPEVAAQRLRGSRHVRPLVTGSADPIAAVRRLRDDRERFYAAAPHHVRRHADPSEVAAEVAGILASVQDPSSHDGADAGALAGTTLLRAETRIGRFVVGDGIAAAEVVQVLDDLGARRAILVSEPGAWAAAGEAIAASLRAQGRDVEVVMLPQGEDAKRLAAVETAARALAALGADRGEPLVAIGGGALGDAAGFLAAIWLRGVPVVQVPTTLVAQIDSSIGGKTAVDLPDGKNLLGAFHQPAAVVVDVAFLRTLDARQRTAALGEAVKMAALGDERLFAALEADGTSIGAGADDAWASGAVAEVVERCLWAKVEVVLADERETAAGGVAGSHGTDRTARGTDATARGTDAAVAGGGVGRIALNLGHTIGHGLEAATGFGPLLHGEAVAYGLRGVCRIGTSLGVTPADCTARIEALLDRLGLAATPLTDVGRSVDVDAVRAAMATDKKRADGRLRWVVPTGTGVVVRDDVPESLVLDAIRSVVAGRERSTTAAERDAPAPTGPA